MYKLEEIKNRFEGAEITILGFENELKSSFGFEFFQDEFYKGIRKEGKAKIGHYRNEIEFYTVSAKIVKEGKDGYYDTIIKISTIRND